MPHKIALIESTRNNGTSFLYALERKGYEVNTWSRVGEALGHPQADEQELWILDADSMRTSGTRLAKKLTARLNTPIIHIAPPKTPPRKQTSKLLTLVMPVGPRLVANRVTRLLPFENAKVKRVGPLKFTKAQKRVKWGKCCAVLTPRLFDLLHYLAVLDGKVATRRDVMETVWQTDYMGDTRTLDVHISWLRGILCDDLNQEDALQTIRGVGYRLNL